MVFKIDEKLKRLPSDTEEEYIWRVGQLVEDGTFANWESITPIINKQWRESEDKYRDESAYRKQFQTANKFYKTVFAKLMQGTEYAEQVKEITNKLYKAKRQFYDQRREYNKLLISEARSEHLIEHLISCANELNNSIPLNFNKDYVQCTPKEAVLCLADWHYGMVTDNIWNKYNTEICKQRIEELIFKCKKQIRLHKPKVLHIILCGDLADGCIHTSSRVSQEEFTCNQIIKVSEILAQAVNELSNCESIQKTKIYSTYGNHMRSIQDKQDSIHEDNMERLIPWWLKQRLQNRNDIEIIDSEFKEFIKLNICGYNLVVTHGDLDNIKNLGVLVNTIFTKKFNTTIDYTISADKHHLEEFESLGIENILLRSLCGTDNYANGKRLYSYAGQTLMFFTKEDGRETTCNIKLH